MPQHANALPLGTVCIYNNANFWTDGHDVMFGSIREIIVVSMNTIRIRTRGLQAALLAGALLFAAGCKREQTAVQPTRTDQQIANDVQAKISAESALNGQSIQVGVTNGMATLSGT